MNTKRNVALFGGSFDPPHNGHVISITHLLNASAVSSDALTVDEVWLVPSGDDRYDKKPIVSAEDRLMMLQAMRQGAFDGTDRIKILDHQLREEFSSSYAIDLVKTLQKEEGVDHFYYVIGADNIEGLPKWKCFDELKTLVTFIVVPRLGESYPAELPSYVRLLQQEPLASVSLSSTTVRELLLDEKIVTGYLPESVIKVIKEKKLYQS